MKITKITKILMCAPLVFVGLGCNTPLSQASKGGELAPSGHHTYWHLKGAEERIEECRKGEREVVFTRNGEPVSNTEVEFDLKMHDFKFGVSLTQNWEQDTPRTEIESKYLNCIEETFNFLTVPTYWEWIEKSGADGDYNFHTLVRDQDEVIKWATERGYTIKGHPLLWHSTLPKRILAMTDPVEVEQAIKHHIKKLFAERDFLKIWDIYNEPVAVMEDHVWESGIKRWVRSYCTDNCVLQECSDPECAGGECKHPSNGDVPGTKHKVYAHQDCINITTKMVYDWAHEYAPNDDIVFVNNHYSATSPANARTGRAKFMEMCEYFEENNVDYDVIGLQTHLHEYGDLFTEERLWQTLEDYSKFGKPIHLTEVTIPGCEPFTDWRDKGAHVRANGEARTNHEPLIYREGDDSWRAFQAEYLSDFCTLAFSHPNVEAIIFWSLSDRDEWQYTTSGLIDINDNPKPAYDALNELVNKKWHTHEIAELNGKGSATLSGYYGVYTATIDGEHVEFSLTKDSPEKIVVELNK